MLNSFLISILGSVIGASIGYFLSKKLESHKSNIVKASDFDKKWAEQFFDACQCYMHCIEKQLVLLTAIGNTQNADCKNQENWNDLMVKINTTNGEITQSELRVRRCVVFAPKKGAAVVEYCLSCSELLRTLLKNRQGNVVEIIEKMNSFNVASRTAHAEMLNLE